MEEQNQKKASNVREALAVCARELAEMLGVSLRQVWRLNSAGRLPKAIRLGGSVRWNRREIMDWFQSGCPDRQTWEARKAVQGSDQNTSGPPLPQWPRVNHHADCTIVYRGRQALSTILWPHSCSVWRPCASVPQSRQPSSTTSTGSFDSRSISAFSRGCSMASEEMQRVTRDRPCPVCGKPDWCLAAADGSAAICQRVQDGSVKRCGDAGWLHILRDDRPAQRSRLSTTHISAHADGSKDFEQLVSTYQRQMTTDRLTGLSQQLGVSTTSLGRLRTGWDGAAFTFPMTDAEGRTIGVRRRFRNGFKCSVRGS